MPLLDFNFELLSGSSNIEENTCREDAMGEKNATEYLPHFKNRNHGLKITPGLKVFNCPKCGRFFTVKGNMNRHLKYECGKAPRFKCPYCDFRSKQSSNVLSHVRNRHTGLEAFVLNLNLENQN